MPPLLSAALLFSAGIIRYASTNAACMLRRGSQLGTPRRAYCAFLPFHSDVFATLEPNGHRTNLRKRLTESELRSCSKK